MSIHVKLFVFKTPFENGAKYFGRVFLPRFGNFVAKSVQNKHAIETF
jgi:hypothetical protein